ncbi:MAG: MgtC/SapB family protein [Stellaceae bacterium]
MPGPLVTNFALLLGLSFFFGLAFEDFYARSGESRPGGIRTFPLLALTGGALYRLDTERLLPLIAGLVVLGAWLIVYYHDRLRSVDAAGVPHVELMVPVCNVLAYLLGPISLTQPPWLAVGITVAAVLLLTGRERLHDLAHRLELREIVIAGEFLILTGLVLPLLPDRPVTTLTQITPYKAWLALLAVCTISYASYLLRRYVAPAGDLWIAALGGLYSSTATTVVLARRAAADRAALPRAQAGIILATALMYPRVLAVIAFFNLPLAADLAPSLLLLTALGLALAAWQYRRAGAAPGEAPPGEAPRNPLELCAAALFAVLFVVISIASSWVKSRFGETGIEMLAAIVGFTDIDPFVLSLAQGVAGPLPASGAVAAVLIATASNNLLKAGYAAAFAGLRPSLPSVAALVALAAGGLGIALWTVVPGG